MSKEFFDFLVDVIEGVEDEDLEDFKMVPVSSSNLAAVGYRPQTATLYVAFLDGSVYKYEFVRRQDFDGLLAADSHGQYFYDNIRETYPFERIA